MRHTGTSFELGGIDIIPLVEIPRLEVNVNEFFPSFTVDKAEWWARMPWCIAEQSKLIYVIQAFLVRTQAEFLLVDAGVGAGKTRKRPEFDALGPRLIDQLAQHGVAKEDISTVVLSHLHVDHVGGATSAQHDQWQPLFPNATYIVSRKELDHWKDVQESTDRLERTGDYLLDSIAPLADAGQLIQIDSDVTVTKNVSLRHTPGHTPGLLSVEIEGDQNVALLVSDMMHHPLQLSHPHVSTRYCEDPLLAAETRIQLLREAARGQKTLIPAHFAGTAAGLVKETSEGSFTWEPQQKE